MVSFSCEACGDVLTKKKLDPHRNRCRGATFTCIDCMVHFYGTDYRAHNSCMSEEQKYQGALYKPKRQKSNGAEPSGRPETMAHNAYVEDVTEEFEDYRQYQVYEDDGNAEANLPPEAPTPPPAVDDDPNVNVFDFLVDQTPNVSNVNLQYFNNMVEASGGGGGGRQLVRFDQGLEDNYVDPTGYMVDDEAMAQFGPDAAPRTEYQTPAPKTHRRKSKDSTGEREVKKDKKRKRLHIETPGPLALTTQRGDEVMTDAPPVLHSGLTGGLNRLMRPSQFPPSPDYSGGDGGENSPASPIKKTKHSKSHKSKPSRTETLSGGLKAFMSGTSKSKISKKRKHSSDKDKKDKKKTRRHSSSDKAPKLIEYRPKSKSGDEKEGESGQMILYRPRSDLFLSLCNKGPESERGCSVNKALKKYHRERSESGTSLGKSVEEKELWRSLRMRRNERGEIVLFSIEPIEP